MTSIVPEGRSLLVMGHPGHELRLYGWVGLARPLVCILTDGSGSDGIPRLEKTLEILRTLGAEIGPLCGELSDRQIYEKILHREHDLFDILCERLVRLILAQNINVVVSDAIEGYNPVHDLCEILVRTAVAIANDYNNANNGNKDSHYPIQHYTILLMDDPRAGAGLEEPGNHAVPPRMIAHQTIELTPSQFRQKLETMRDYAASAGGILQQEVDDAFLNYGEHAFAREYLFAAAEPGQEPERGFSQLKPFYETYGEERVAAGHYQSVIRFREHVLPLVNRLQEKVSTRAPGNGRG
jgi:hypothetical protein